MYNRIKELRKINRLTQKELAEKAKIGFRTISDYERGISVPDADALRNLASVFNVSTDYLLGTTDIKGSFGKTDASDVKIALYNQLGELNEEQVKDALKYIEYLKSQNK